jgi:hypothetical protein
LLLVSSGFLIASIFLEPHRWCNEELKRHHEEMMKQQEELRRQKEEMERQKLEIEKQRQLELQVSCGFFFNGFQFVQVFYFVYNCITIGEPIIKRVRVGNIRVSEDDTLLQK